MARISRGRDQHHHDPRRSVPARRWVPHHPGPDRDRHLRYRDRGHRRAVELIGARLDHISSLAETLVRAGVDVNETPEGLSISRMNGHVKGVDIMTEPFPGFPTDLQAQAMSLMTVAEGAAFVSPFCIGLTRISPSVTADVNSSSRE